MKISILHLLYNHPYPFDFDGIPFPPEGSRPIHFSKITAKYELTIIYVHLEALDHIRLRFGVDRDPISWTGAYIATSNGVVTNRI